MGRVADFRPLAIARARSLYFLFDKTLEKAIGIVHNAGVKRVVGENSGREIFQVSRPPMVLRARHRGPHANVDGNARPFDRR